MGRALALDLGSSSVRALVLGDDFEPVAGGVARGPASLRQDASGAAVIEPDAYVAALVGCLDELGERGLLDGVDVVATSSQWHSLVALGRDGRPMTDVVTWADTRALGRPGREPADPTAFHRRTGAWRHGFFWTVRIPWLRTQLAGTPARFAGLSEHVLSLLVGDGACSASIASGTGLLDIGEMAWDGEALELAGVAAAELPPLAPPGWGGRLAPRWRRRWPGLAEATWAPPTGDGAASNIGAGCVDAGRVAVTVGTSAAVRVVADAGEAGTLPDELWRYRVDERRVVTGAAYSGGGNVRAWAEAAFAGAGARGLAAVVPGSHGVTALPFHAGSRPPQTIPACRARFAGVGLGTTGAQLAAAALEGVCLETELGLRSLRSTLPAEPTVVLNGGGLHDHLWWQRAFAATFRRELLVCTVREMAARGAALLARGLEAEPGYARVEPSGEDVASMDAARERYLRLRADAVTGAGEAR